MNNVLMNAILSMDAYNRGYNAGIGGLGGVGSYLGDAKVINESNTLTGSNERNADFYAIAYDYNGQKIISYRGTDNLITDPITGWGVGGGSVQGSQALMAFQFYNAVAGGVDPRTANITLTGHSMGGGFAGMVGSIYGKSATLFDNMAFTTASQNILTPIAPTVLPGGLLDYTLENQRLTFLSSIYGTYTPSTVLNKTGLSAHYMQGEALALPYTPGNHNNQGISETSYDLGYTPSGGGIFLPSDLHSMSSLVMAIYASGLANQDWKYASPYFWPALYNGAFANSIGITTQSVPGSITTSGDFGSALRQIIAYSAIDSGTLVFGNTAIVSLYDDANDLGKALQTNASLNIIASADKISQIMIEYAGKLAMNHVQGLTSSFVNGVLKASHDGQSLVVNVDALTWASAGLGATIASKIDLLNEVFYAGGGGGMGFVLTQTDMGTLWGDSTVNAISRVMFSNKTSTSATIDAPSNSLATVYLASEGNDTILGSSGNDLILGGYGSDSLIGGAGSDILDGGIGTDTVSYAYDAQGIYVTLLPSMGIAVGGTSADIIDGTGAQDKVHSIEIIEGSAGSDTFTIQAGTAKDQIVILRGGNGGDVYDVMKFGMGVSIDEKAGDTGSDAVLVPAYVTPATYEKSPVPGGTELTPQNGQSGPSVFVPDNVEDTQDPGGTRTPISQFPDAAPPPPPPAIGPIYATPGITNHDPLILDLDRDGQINITDIQHGVYYDMQLDGFKERTAWVGAGDGMLVYDADNNGVIEGYHEFLTNPGSMSFALFSIPGIDMQSGFAAMSNFDSNHDGKLDVQDAGYNQLKVWQDINQNGVTDAGELKTLSQWNIKSIDITGVVRDPFLGVSNSSGVRNINGNSISHASTFTLNDGTTHEIVDAWLSHDMMNTKYMGSYVLDPKVLFLPTLRGFGELPDFHVAMSQNSALLSTMETFAAKRSFTQLFSDFQNVRSEVRDMLFQWAGVSKTSAPSNLEAGFSGVFSLMPEYYFLKKFMGVDSAHAGMWFDETPFAPYAPDGVAAVMKSFDMLLTELTSQLIYQIGADDLFQTSPEFNYILSSFSGTFSLSQTSITQLQAVAATQSNKPAFWNNFIKFLDVTEGLSNISTAEISMLNTAIKQSTSNTLDWAGALATLGDHQITTSVYKATMNGSQWDDTIIAYAGSSTQKVTMNGGAGDDHLYGASGNDILQGGAGNDYLSGYLGSDTYIYDSGHDIIDEPYLGASDSNIIQFATGIKLSDITVKTFDLKLRYSSHTYLDVAGRGTITIASHSGIFDSQAIKQLKFADGTVINFADMPVKIMGTENNDYFSVTGAEWKGASELYGLDGDDYIFGDSQAPYAMTFIGGNGDDYITGGIGNSTYVYESGNDTYYELGGEGNDKIVFDSSITSSMVTIGRKIVSGNYAYNNDMTITISGLGSISLMDQYLGDGKIDTLQFSNGVTINIGTVGNSYDIIGTDTGEVLNGLDRDPIFLQDRIFGKAGNDTLNGGLGDDILLGGEGSDNYVHNQGIDYIYDDGYTAGDIDKIIFSSSFDPSKFSYVLGKDALYHNALYLDILYNGTLTARIDGQFSGYGFGVEQLIVTGKATIDLRAMAFDQIGDNTNNVFIGIPQGASFNEHFYGFGGDDSISAGQGNDTLVGGSGNDWLDGGSDNDIYEFSSGFGIDQISDVSGADTIAFKQGITIDNISIVHANDVLRIVATPGVDEVWFYLPSVTGSVSMIENISFLDGFKADLTTFRTWKWGTNAAQTTSGTTGADTILGRGGNDTINGNGGNDALHGGAGNDIVKGGAGNDLVHGGIGNDTLYGDAGNDVIYGDDGLDKLYGGTGSDTFMFLKETAFNNIDVIYDFKKAENDKINIADLLQGYDPVTKAITDYVQITTSGANSILKVDADGGANNFVQIATINGITGITDEQALVNSGHLIV